MRDRGYFRYVRNKAIARKKRISRGTYGLDWYSVDGKYSKGKVHCGCGLCKWGRKYGVPAWALHRQEIAMLEEMKEYGECA